MGTSIESKVYPEVTVRIHKDIESGIIMTKSYNILKNAAQVRDTLTVMCLKHDLKCYDCSQDWVTTTFYVHFARLMILLKW